MVWYFTRHGERLRYEVRYGGVDVTYEIAVTYPDGRTQVEHVQDAVDLLHRCADVARALQADGWRSER